MTTINTRSSSLVGVFFAMILSFYMAGPVPVEAYYSGGSGTSGDPYWISTFADLTYLANTTDDWDLYFIQKANIDATATSTWNALTDRGSWASGISYNVGEVVDHNSKIYYCISSHTSSGTDEPGIGADWRTYWVVTISKCQGWSPIGNSTTKFTGSYDGQGYKITNLLINRPKTDNQGLFGHVGDGTSTNPVIIKNLKLESVNVQGARGVGALVGRVTGNRYTLIGNCYSKTGTATGDGATGGLIGSHNSSASAPGDRTELPTLSYSWSDLSVSFSQGTDIDTKQDKFGGLVGCSQKGLISNCYARGSVTVNVPTGKNAGQRVGGLAGCNVVRGEIEYSYSTGSVTVNNCSLVGAFLGNRASGGTAGIVTASFWNPTDSSPTETSAAGGTESTQANMKILTTYTGAAWNFTNVWDIVSGVNDGYPYLLQGQALLVELASLTATPSQNGILLEWETASEIDHAGFHIWRSYSADGTYTQITDALIPAEGGRAWGPRMPMKTRICFERCTPVTIRIATGSTCSRIWLAGAPIFISWRQSTMPA